MLSSRGLCPLTRPHSPAPLAVATTAAELVRRREDMARKGRKGRGDDSDDDAPQAKPAAEPQQQQSSRQALKEKRKARQAKKAAHDSDSDDDVAKLILAKMQAGATLSDDEDEPAPASKPAPKGKAKAKAAATPAPAPAPAAKPAPSMAMLAEDEDSDEDAPRKGKSKKGAKQSKKKQQVESDDEEAEHVSPRRARAASESDEEDEERSPRANGKASKKKDKKSRAAEPEPEPEPEPAAAPAPTEHKDEVEELADDVEAVSLEDSGPVSKRKISKAERRAMKKAGKSAMQAGPIPEAQPEPEEGEEQPAMQIETVEAAAAETAKKPKKTKKKKTELELMLEAAERKAAEAGAAPAVAAAATPAVAAAATEKPARDSRKQKEAEPTKKEEEDEEEEDTYKDADDQIAAQIEEMRRANAGSQFAVSQSAINENDANWQNALDIIIPNFSISAHNKELFRNASLHIVHGRKYGLVGPNGAGKSTLLKMIASGDLKIPPRIDALYVEQEVVPDDTPAVQAVLRADTRRFALQEEQQRLEERLEQEEDIDEAVLDRLAEIHDQLSSMGADAAEAHARRILFGLGFDAEMQDRPTKAFSGGWRMRISLAKALYLEPTLLMLDEPTNHLDLNAVIWLDDYLSKWKKTLLIVSHDQDFLNSVCEEILHLNAKKIDAYRGNYDQFKEMELQKRKQQQVAWEKQQKKIRALKQAGKSKAQAEATAKSKYRESGGAKKNKKQSDAIAVGSQNAETVELIERPREYTVHFEFPEVPQLSPPIISVNDVSFRYGSKGKWIFKDINFGLDMDSRICIVGPNGAGKSTLLKLITGALQPTTGEINVNPRLRMGIYNQHFIDRLPLAEDAVTYLRRLFNLDYQTARNRLGKYGLEGHAHELPMRDLSGGQKARVVLVELSLMAPHMLLLDEPTNNLDIESIDALCEAIREYNGGVVLVSHDARLIETTECQMWVVDNQTVTPFEAGFDAYRQNILQQLEEQMQRQEQEMAAKRAAALALQEKKRADKAAQRR